MWLFLLFIGAVGSLIADDIHTNPQDTDRPLIYEGEQIEKIDNLSNILDESKDSHKVFKSFVNEAITQEGRTFNIYDDDMRNATISLFRILLELRHNDKNKYDQLLDWAEIAINSDMLDYAKRIVALFSPENTKENFLPPFIAKPNYFVNGETILKAFYVKKNIEKISSDVMKIYQIFRIDNNFIAINTNYSQWNGPFNACDKEIKYFTEDVGLNSYYYGLHLLHPFWMSNEELSQLNPRHAEHYYYAHQQLYARYLLEKEHLDSNLKSLDTMCELDYNPYLYYENGLPFPTRSSLIGQEIRGDLAYLKTIDAAIKECIHKGLVVMENGTYIRITEENYIDLLAKLIRANLDGIKATKVIRSLFGYGYNGYRNNKYNPSPSVLNHPQTTLREPVYWFLIKTALEYFSEYEHLIEPYDIAMYESDKYLILDANVSRIATNFQDFFINLYKSLEGHKSLSTNSSLPFICARQRRLNHEQFTINLTILAKAHEDVVIRLFLGPQCNIEKCAEIYYKFFQLDSYRYKLIEGNNTVIWTPATSSRYEDSEKYSATENNFERSFDVFKFPKNLIIPKGTEDGLNLTLFVMILDDEEGSDVLIDSRLYSKITREIDSKPLGFPLHRKVALFNEFAPNYKFVNVTIFHTKTSPDEDGYFSSYLY